MELYQLKTFVTVAEEGHLTRASNRLNSSQPAISAHIKALESELGITLFDRTPKGMRLTTEGMELKVKAASILAAADDLRFTARSLTGVLSGDARLGLHTDPKLLKITDLLVEFRRRYPNLSVSFLQKTSKQAPAELLAEEIDTAFVYSRPEDDTIKVQLLDRIQLAVIAPKIWQKRLQQADIKDLLDYPWVWTDNHCPLYASAVKLFSTTGQEPAKAVIVDQETAIVRLVSEGVGLSLVPAVKAKETALASQLFISNIDAGYIDLSLIYLKKRRDDPLVTAILGVIKKMWEPYAHSQSTLVHHDMNRL